MANNTMNDENKKKALDAAIAKLEKDFDDDTESIITNERYTYISSIIDDCVKKAHSKDKLSTSDKIDKIVTNRILALPIFAAVMFLVYYIAMVIVGSAATDWANDGLFGDGFHLFGIGTSAYEEVEEEYGDSDEIIAAYVESLGSKGEAIADAIDTEADDYDSEEAVKALTSLKAMVKSTDTVDYTVEDEETLETTEDTADADAIKEAIDLAIQYDGAAPDPADYGVWVPGIPVLIEDGLDAIGCADWLKGLILDGIVAGVGAVLGFVPQMAILFLFLSILEDCGYMVRIAFVMDRVFRHFGLSGKSFIPLLISSGCGIPGIMASKTIEQDNDRRLTIMTATFIPCGAKLPVIALMGGVMAGYVTGWDVAGMMAPIMYFVGIVAVLVSAIMLKKTKPFSGKPAPFVMELPAYHIPSAKTVLLHVWERLKGFIIKAGTILFLACVVMWFLSSFGFVDGGFGLVEESADSILAMLGGAIAILFRPLGFGEWQPVAASITGFTAKEAIVSTMGVLANVSEDLSEETDVVAAAIQTWFPTTIAAFTFLLFNLLDSPCLAAIATMAQQLQSRKWFWFAILYQNLFAYAVSLIVYQLGGLVLGAVAFNVWTIVAAVLLVLMLFMLFRPDPYKDQKSYTRSSVEAAS